MVSTIYKNFLFVLLLSGSLVVLHAQQKPYLSAGDSDSRATSILKKTSAKIKAFSSYEMLFKLTHYLNKSSQKEWPGVYRQSGKKFYFDLDQQLVVSNGKVTWLYIKNRNEVQLNDAESDETTMLSPKFFTDLYENKDFAYVLSESTASQYLIDFKPLDKRSSYAKVTLKVNKKTNLPAEIIVINKDGTRYYFKEITFDSKKKFNDSLFIFNVARYPGISVEDLRL